MRKSRVDLMIGLAQAWPAFLSASNSNEDRIATNFAKWFTNEYLVNVVITGNTYFGQSIPLNGLKTLDFLGINYYTRYFVKNSSEPPYYRTVGGSNPTTELGWEICPEELRDALDEASQFQIPVLVTENGLEDKSDHQRSDFLRSHINVLLKAKKEGLPIMGYLHWSLTDNFEWGCGMSCRFGLVDVDYLTLERTPRKSFYEYKKIIAENSDYACH